MGYTTEFRGTFQIDPPLPGKVAKQIQEFNRQRHEDNKEPGIWCGWTVGDGNEALYWDGKEKFYNYIAWLQLIIDRFIKPTGSQVNGRVMYMGESKGDYGVIEVENNEINQYKGVA